MKKTYQGAESEFQYGDDLDMLRLQEILRLRPILLHSANFFRQPHRTPSYQSDHSAMFRDARVNQR